MWPNPFGIPSIAVVLPVAVAVGMAVPLAFVRRDGHATWRVALYLIVLGVAALAGAKGFSLLEREALVPLSGELFYGYRHPGGLLALALAAPFCAVILPRDVPLLRLLDYLAPGAALAMATIRVDCLLGGCCAGGVCALPWAIRFPRFSAVWEQQLAAGLIDGSAVRSLPTHPLQLYLLLLALAVAIALLYRLPRKAFDGEIALVLLVLHETGKFALESLRVPHQPVLQAASMLAALLAALILVRAAAPARRGRSAPALVPPPGGSLS